METDWQWFERKRQLYEERLLRDDETMVPALEARLKQGSPDTDLIVLALYHALLERNSPWLWRLLWSWVNGRSVRLKAAALSALRSGVYQQPGVQEALWEHAESDSPAVRRAAIGSLLNAMEAGLEFRPRTLRGWVLDEDIEVRLATLDALVIIGGEHQRFSVGLLERALREPEARAPGGRSTHDAALASLSTFSQHWLELVLLVLERLAPRVDQALRRRIAESLLVYLLGERYLGALPHLRRWLEQGHPTVKQMLVWALPLVAEEPKLDLLERLVREESDVVRLEVVRALEAEVDSYSPAGVQRAFAALNFAAAEGGPATQAAALALLSRVRAVMDTEDFRRRVREQRKLPKVESKPGRTYELE